MIKYDFPTCRFGHWHRRFSYGTHNGIGRVMRREGSTSKVSGARRKTARTSVRKRTLFPMVERDKMETWMAAVEGGIHVQWKQRAPAHAFDFTELQEIRTPKCTELQCGSCVSVCRCCVYASVCFFAVRDNLNWQKIVPHCRQLVNPNTCTAWNYAQSKHSSTLFHS